MEYAVVVPWHRDEEIDAFLENWGVTWEDKPEWLVLQHDAEREGCGATKNKGVARAADMNAEVVVILDGDCYPAEPEMSLSTFAQLHRAALEPQNVDLFQAVTYPPSRGTPYRERTLRMPVAASMGFWFKNPDHCAVRQLAYANGPMTHVREAIYGRYFALCGMNLAFRPGDWLPWCEFIDVERFDDVWMGWLWQKEAYRRGCCFNLAGPLVTHARQSNVWKNLRAEIAHLETSETLWRKIAMHPSNDYATLRRLLPCE
jgi:hypothetical protein